MLKWTLQGWPKEFVMGCENVCNLCVAISGTRGEVGRFFSPSLSLPANLPKNGLQLRVKLSAFIYSGPPPPRRGSMMTWTLNRTNSAIHYAVHAVVL